MERCELIESLYRKVPFYTEAMTRCRDVRGVCGSEWVQHESGWRARANDGDGDGKVGMNRRPDMLALKHLGLHLRADTSGQPLLPCPICWVSAGAVDLCPVISNRTAHLGRLVCLVALVAFVDLCHDRLASPGCPFACPSPSPSPSPSCPASPQCCWTLNGPSIGGRETVGGHTRTRTHTRTRIHTHPHTLCCRSQTQPTNQ